MRDALRNVWSGRGSADVGRPSRLCVGVLALAASALGLFWDIEPSVADPPTTGTLAGSVTITRDGAAKADRSGVVVYLEGVPGALPDTSRVREIRQKNLSFNPGLMVIVKGTTVAFPNDDLVFHNVFSLSKAAKFDLGLYKGGTSKSVTFKKAGVVDIYCNIHPQMVTKIKVLDTGYFGVTASDGTFRIPNVPAGTYPVVAWQASGEEFHGATTVAAGGTATLTIALIERQAPRTHLRKDGTPYGRYQ